MNKPYDQDAELFEISPELFVEIQEALRSPNPNPVEIHDSVLSDIGWTPELQKLNDRLRLALENHEINRMQFQEAMDKLSSTNPDIIAEYKSEDAWQRLEAAALQLTETTTERDNSIRFTRIDLLLGATALAWYANQQGWL